MISSFFSKGRNVILCWVVFLAWGIFLFSFSLYPQVKELSKNADLPEEKFGFTSEYLYSFFERLGTNGRDAYFSFQLMDLLNAVLFGVALFAALFYFLRKLNANSFFNVLLALPVISALLDVSENFVFLYLLSIFLERSESLVRLASFLTSAKLTIGSLAFIAAVICGLTTLIRFFVLKVKG